MGLWLVTGGAGFIGSNIVKKLLSMGERVRVLDNYITGKERNLEGLKGDLEVLRGDVRDLEICRQATEGVDYVLHQAALGSVPRSVADPLDSHASNVTGTVNVLVASRDAKVKRVVCAGSSSVYGQNPTLPRREDQLPMPVSPYAVTKLAQEQYCLAFQACYGMEVAVLRYFNIFGPNQDPDSRYAAVIPKFFAAAITKKQPEIYGDGEQTRDFTFVEDCVDANLKAATAPLQDERVFNIAGGRQVSINQLWRSVKKVCGGGSEAKYLPTRAGDVRHSVADVSRAARVLGWKAATGLEAGLEVTREWFLRDRAGNG